MRPRGDKFKARLVKDVLYYVYNKGEVTFLDLQQHLLDKGLDIMGDYSMEIDDYNILLWDGWKSELVDAVSDLLDNNNIALQVCSILDYDNEEFCIMIDIIEEYPIERLSKQSWLPMVLCETIDN